MKGFWGPPLTKAPPRDISLEVLLAHAGIVCHHVAWTSASSVVAAAESKSL